MQKRSRISGENDPTKSTNNGREELADQVSISLSLSVSMIQSVFKYETQTGHNQGSISGRK